MRFTFGICSSGQNFEKVVDSIVKQNIPEYEIIVVGGQAPTRDNVHYITFDESTKPGWITAKKNLITGFASYENIVYMHDYVALKDDWYEGFLKFGGNWDVCMTRVENFDGERNLDWYINYNDLTLPNGEQLLPYTHIKYSKMMYIPGFYWVAKKSLMEEFPLNENLCWGQAEDLEWSYRVRNKYSFSMNPFSSVQFTKQKEYRLNEMSEESLRILEEVYNARYQSTL